MAREKSEKWDVIIWPLREAINTLQRGESALISDNVIIYLRDVYDHTI